MSLLDGIAIGDDAQMGIAQIIEAIVNISKQLPTVFIKIKIGIKDDVGFSIAQRSFVGKNLPEALASLPLKGKLAGKVALDIVLG